MAVALHNNELLREKIKALSKYENNKYYKEILVKDLMSVSLNGETVKEYLGDIVINESEALEIGDFDSFISNLLEDLPLLVVKIPDWLINTEWNITKKSPNVFSNLYGFDHKVYGFKGNGAIYTKHKYFESESFEVLVKNSEDYFLIKDISILEYLQHPCMSIANFVSNYCEIWNEGILVKKRDLQSLYAECASDYKENTKMANTDCPRNEGHESNYMMGFQLSVPSILSTMHNDGCVAGEETFDFQVDLHFGIRTGEEEFDFSRHLMLPLYGIRYAELLNVDGSPKKYNIFSDYLGKYLNYIDFIDENANDWDRDKFGNNIIVLWSEVDFLDCENKKYLNLIPDQYTYSFPIGFFGKDKVASAKYNTSKLDFVEKTGIIFGRNKIDLGWNNYSYCEDLKAENPTGLQALEVFFEFTLQN